LGRSQGSGFLGPVTCDDSGRCERCLAGPAKELPMKRARSRKAALTWARVVERGGVGTGALAATTALTGHDGPGNPR